MKKENNMFKIWLMFFVGGGFFSTAIWLQEGGIAALSFIGLMLMFSAVINLIKYLN